MNRSRGRNSVLAVFFLAFALAAASAVVANQGAGGAGTVQGSVADPTGAVIPGATVDLHDPVTGYRRTITTDLNGNFVFRNVPLNPYHLAVSATGFQTHQQDVSVRSSVPVTVNVSLTIAATSASVTVEASDLTENTPTAHTDISDSLAAKLPVASRSSALSSVLTLAAPGIVADSNGLFHPLGEHADTSFSVDNQPINDQQSRAFSNQLPLDVFQSLEAISGVPPAEFGDKTSLVVRTTTKSGLGLVRPTGSLNFGYGSFGTPSVAFTLGAGGKKAGNFLALDGLRTGRFFDPPEFVPLHDIGNAATFFDRAEWQPSARDTLHLNLWLSRSWTQVPNSYDQQRAGQDQRQQIRSFNVAPGFTHLFGQNALLTANLFVRRDQVGYFPSSDPFADQPATLGERRRLTNAGIRTDVSWVKGIHNFKAGVQFMHTFLTEDFRLGLTDPAFNPICLDAAGGAVTDPAFTDPAQCAAAGLQPNPNLLAGLVPYDLTRGGSLFSFRGHTDVKQEALYVQDTLTLGQLTLSPGVRVDNYDGLSQGSAVQPRFGISYLFKASNTVLRASYGRLFETPYNENLVISSTTGAGGLAGNVFGAVGDQPLRPGARNQFNVGFQQGLGTRLVVDAEYFWKFTRTAFDFDTLFSTPLVFPIEWRKSKIDGFTARVTFPAHKGLSAYTALGHTRARFFGPEIGGIIFNSPLATGPFRIDHDEALEQTTHAQYQLGKLGPWFGFTWRYDSGAVAGAVPDAASALALTGDQQAQMALFCGSVFATVTAPIRSCPAGQVGATRVRIPAPGSANDDRNPPRIAPRHLFDLGAGIDNLLRTDRPRVSLRLTVVNLTNQAALYNFLSTFSGTHFVTPRSLQAQVGFAF